MKAATADNPLGIIRLSVDGYRSGILRGRVNIPGMQARYAIANTMEFLKKTNAMLDMMSRSIFPPAPAAGREEAEPGRLATFEIRVLFRENASWQGSLLWEDEGQSKAFDSTMDMLMQIDEALGGILPAEKAV